MKYKKYIFEGYNLHLLKSKHFKEVRVEFKFRQPIKRNLITKVNFLSNILVRSTRKYPTERLLCIEEQKLYGATIGSEIYRRGNYLFSEFNLFTLNDKYTEKGNLVKGINLLIDEVFDPNIINKAFDEETFDIVYRKIKEEIEIVKENKDRYTVIKTKELMDSNAPYAYLICGTLEDLNKITPSNLYNYYLNFLKTNLLDIFVTGDFDEEEVKKVITSRIKIKPIIKNSPEIIYEGNKFRKRVRKYFEQDDIKQAVLCLGYKLKGTTKYEKQCVIPLLNNMLSNTENSLLFNIVREKHSLCYSIDSYFDILSNIMYIIVGIDKEQYIKTIKLINEILDNIKNGKVSDKLLKDAKTIELRFLTTFEESSKLLINVYDYIHLFNLDDIDTWIKKIKRVSIDDIVTLSKKIIPDVIFMLHGGDK